MKLRKIARRFMKQMGRPGPSSVQRQTPHARVPAADQSQAVNDAFFTSLVNKTENFGHITWLGHPIWQNVLDLWVIQETISEVRPQLIIECGTNRGGSSLFFAHLFDLLGQGEIITVDIEKLHNLTHPRITYLLGSSTAPEIVAAITQRAARVTGPVLVILDSDHSERHVYSELVAYAPLVTPGSYCLVQDGVIDTLPLFAGARPGPLPALERYVQENTDFSIDLERSSRFLITHHPRGWLRRAAA
jgi:cephalosporin hydroxylase